MSIGDTNSSDPTGSRTPRSPDRALGVDSLDAPRDGRNALLCGLVVVVAIALTIPVAELSFNDDWSYAMTVKRLVETGRITYNGWSSASLIAQVYWGAAWVELFGFSFTLLRLSTVPLSASAVSLCYLLARRAGLAPRRAVFASLLLGLSPLYLPIAGTFMTDAPGLFCIFASLYAIVRAAEETTTRRAIAWLALGMVVGGIGGTGRQIVWVVPLVVGPYAAFLRSRDRPFFLATAVGWALVLASAVLTLRWFNRQPLTIPEPSPLSDLAMAARNPAHFLMSFLLIGFTTVLVTLPAMARRTRVGLGPREGLALVLMLAWVVVVSAGKRQRYALLPWMDNTLTPHGVMGDIELFGYGRPVALPVFVRAGFAVAVFAASSLLVADVLLWIARPLRAARATVAFFARPQRTRIALPALTLFAAAYMVLVLPRLARDMAFDRYVLPLIPCLAIPILLRDAPAPLRPRPLRWPAWTLLGIYACYAVASTQEVTALARARVAAAGRLTAAGVPRSQIDGGFEYDSWTQIDRPNGHENDPRIRPRSAYNPDEDMTPAVKARYRLEFILGPDTKPTPFGTVSYLSYLPPFHRTIRIDEFQDPWWLDPARAADHPPTKPKHFLHDAAVPQDER